MAGVFAVGCASLYYLLVASCIEIFIQFLNAYPLNVTFAY